MDSWGFELHPGATIDMVAASLAFPGPPGNQLLPAPQAALAPPRHRQQQAKQQRQRQRQGLQQQRQGGQRAALQRAPDSLPAQQLAGPRCGTLTTMLHVLLCLACKPGGSPMCHCACSGRSASSQAATSERLQRIEAKVQQMEQNLGVNHPQVRPPASASKHPCQRLKRSIHGVRNGQICASCTLSTQKRNVGLWCSS